MTFLALALFCIACAAWLSILFAICTGKVDLEEEDQDQDGFPPNRKMGY